MLSLLFGTSAQKIVLKRYTSMKFFFAFFCRNRNLVVRRACNTRFLKIVFDSAEIFDFQTFPHMLSQRRNPFRECSASDKIRSAYAQPEIKFVPRMFSINLHVKTVHILPLAEHARKFVPCMLSVQ